MPDKKIEITAKNILTPQQEAIQVLGGIMSAVYEETNDPVLKQFINMMVGAAAKEYDEQSHDPLAPILFTPKELTRVFRESIAHMRAGLKDLERMALIDELEHRKNNKH